jgi:N-glycosylase/DNA lyase
MDFLDAMMAPHYRLVAEKARGMEKVLYEKRGHVTVEDLRLAVQILAYDVHALASMLAAAPIETPLPVESEVGW